jgi:hypothetical protein
LAGASAGPESDALRVPPRSHHILHDAPAEEAIRILIADSSDALNDFYTRQEVGLEARKPTTGVPDEVISALADTLEQAGMGEVRRRGHDGEPLRLGEVETIPAQIPARWDLHPQRPRVPRHHLKKQTHLSSRSTTRSASTSRSTLNTSTPLSDSGGGTVL